MKSFPYRLLFLCIFLPPLLYILTLNILEEYFQKRATSTLNNIIIRDYEALYEGRHSLKEEINRNLGEYLLSQAFKYGIGLRINILVKTKDDRILYPSQFQKDLDDASEGQSGDEWNYIDVAAENYRLLNEGLILSINVSIKHNSWLSNSILVFYVLSALLIIKKSTSKNIIESQRLEQAQKESIERLSHKLKDAERELSDIREKENAYLNNISELKKDRENLSTDIDGLLEEMESLEEGLGAQRDLRVEREKEVSYLKEEIERLKEKIHKPGKKKKSTESFGKRFKVLYKNLEFTEKAIEGFLSLSDEFQLKAEEIIHRLNGDDSMVSVKRKVFSKGGKINILEVDFAYSGRIYIKKDSSSKTKIVVIGTKKSQNRDLGFLEREYN